MWSLLYSIAIAAAFAVASYPIVTTVLPRLAASSTPLSHAYATVREHEPIVSAVVSLASYPLSALFASTIVFFVTYAALPTLFGIQCFCALLLAPSTRDATVAAINSHCPWAALPAHAVLRLAKTTRSRTPRISPNVSPIPSPTPSPLIVRPPGATNEDRAETPDPDPDGVVGPL